MALDERAAVFLKKLRWKRKKLSPVWLEGSVTEVQAPVGKARAKEVLTVFGISRAVPRPGWEIILDEKEGIYLVNSAGRFRVDVRGDLRFSPLLGG